jgi:hypothetical protein
MKPNYNHYIKLKLKYEYYLSIGDITSINQLQERVNTVENISLAKLFTENPQTRWTFELCKLDALKYTRRGDWKKGSVGAYGKARKNGWLYECCGHMTSHTVRTMWTFEVCKLDALNYTRRGDWSKGNISGYAKARMNGWLDECCEHMTKPQVKTMWTFELCKVDALNYTRRGGWSIGSSSAYGKAVKNGWLDECCTHMEDIRTIWTFELCKLDALNYTRRVDWMKGSSSAYGKARKKGWLDECCGHMTKRFSE